MFDSVSRLPDRESTQRATVPELNRRSPRGPLRVLFKCLEDEAAITAAQTERSLMNFIEIPPTESNGDRIESQEGVKHREAEGKLPVHPSLVFTHPSRTNLTLLWMLPRESAVFALSLSFLFHSPFTARNSQLCFGSLRYWLRLFDV